MKLVVQVKLLPTPQQAAALTDTLHHVNTAANHVSAIAFDKFGLRGRETPCGRCATATSKRAGSAPRPPST